MQSNGARIGVLVVAVAAVVVLFVVLSGGDDDDGGTTSVATQPTTETGDGGDGGKEEPKPKPEPEVPVIVIENGQPKGGVAELSFAKDDQVSFVVKSGDTSAEVHVHGYDIMAELAPGEPARFEFEAKIEGAFEVELEETATEIAELAVTP